VKNKALKRRISLDGAEKRIFHVKLLKSNLKLFTFQREADKDA